MRMKETEDCSSRRVDVTGFVEATLPDVPADFLFDEYVNTQNWAVFFRDVLRVERYDPTARSSAIGKKKWRKKKISRKDIIPVNANAEGQPELARPGYCYLQTRDMGGSPHFIRTMFTRVDDDFNEENKRTFVTMCSGFSDSTVTCSVEVERHVNSGPGCHVRLTWAMLPDGWYGKLLFWCKAQQFKDFVTKVHVNEIDQVKRAVEAKYKNNVGTSPSWTSSMSSNPNSMYSLGEAASAGT